MSGSLEGPAAKLRRAAHHYGVLKNELHGGLDRKMRPVTVEVNRQGCEYCFYVGAIEPPDPDWPLVVGDCVHNLRSALDHLVYQLHVRRFRGNVPDDVATRCTFPIIDKRWRYKNGRKKGQLIPSEEWGAIKHLSRRERTAIEWLQPCNRRNDALSPVRGHLLDIHSLDRADKHRHLHFVHIAVVSVPNPSFPPEFGFETHPAFGVPLVSNACVYRWTFLKPPPADKVNVNGGVYTTVGLEYGGERLEILALLGGCLLITEMVLSRFGRCFPPLEEPIDLSWVRGTSG